MGLRPVEQWKDEVAVVLESKRSEFEMLGYKEITVDGIWDCLIQNILKNNEETRLHEIVQAIFQLQIHTYMDFLALDSLHNIAIETDDELMASINAVMQREE